jgi:hypothetical protein
LIHEKIVVNEADVSTLNNFLPHFISANTVNTGVDGLCKPFQIYRIGG